MANKGRKKADPGEPHQEATRGSTIAWVIPNATVFISSFCIMVIELVAGRIIARHLGFSIYTWTSVIGVVLAGIAVGNYIGGRLADRFSAKRTLAILFIFSSAASAAIIVLEGVVGDWTPLWTLSWPMRVASHVTLVFIVPSAILGMISPVVAKMALDLGRQTGRTIGSVYAWGVVGSIAGTFMTGFWFIATIGTAAIVWSVAAVLAIMGVLYLARSWTTWAWAAALALLALVANSPWAWAQAVGEALALREPSDPSLLYSDESQYAYIRVVQVSKSPDVRSFFIDKLMHSQVDMDDPMNFLYEYEKVYASITKRLSRGKKYVHSLTIGGAGYVYPRYMEATWPGSRTEVVEIDPATTEAAMAAFGLPRDTSIKIYHEDGRVLIDRLARRNRRGGPVALYDFIYCDAVNDYSVPYQLTTREFMEMVRGLIAPDGAYLMNMIDIYDSGLLLGSLINTMETVFQHVYVFVEGLPVARFRNVRNTFILAGLNREFSVQGLGSEYDSDCKIFVLSDEEMAELRRKSHGMILTDDHAPVEKLLAPVVKQSSKQMALKEWLKRADRALSRKNYRDAIKYLREATDVFPGEPELLYHLGYACLKAGELEQALARFKKVLEIDPSHVNAHLDMAEALLTKGDTEEGIIHYYEALRLKDDPVLRYNLAVTLAEIGRRKDAIKQYALAVGAKPDFPEAYNNWGAALAGLGWQKEAIEKYEEAIHLKPQYAEAHFNLARALSSLGKYEQALASWQKVLELAPDNADAYHGYGTALFRQGRYEEALSAYSKAAAINPGLSDAHFNMAVILEAQGKLEEALRACRNAIRHSPEDVQMQRLLERILQRQRQDSDAGIDGLPKGDEG